MPRFVIPLVWTLPSLLILCSGTALPVAHAAGSVSPPQTLEPSSPAEERLVVLQVAGSDAAVLALAQAMNDPFRRAGVKLRVRRIESVSEASLEPRKSFSKQNTIYIGFDLLQPGRATLYVTTSHDDRIYARDFELPDGLSEVAMEQLVVAARTSVEAALMGIPIGDPRKDFGTQRPSAQAQVPKPRSLPKSVPGTPNAFSVTVRTHLEMLAREALLFGPGIGLSLRSKSAYLGAGGQVHAPVNVRGGPLLLELFTGRIGGFGGVRAQLAGPLHFEAASSLAVELTQVRTTARDTSAAVSEPRYLAFDPLIGVALGPALRFERWQVALLAGLNVNLLDVRYTFDDAGAERTLFRPWSARPMLSLDWSTSL